MDFPIPNRINRDPVVVIGCTDVELRYLTFSFSFIWFLVFLFFFGLALGQWKIGAIVFVFLTIGSVYISGRWIGKIRDGRPDGYFMHFIFINFYRLVGLESKLPYIMRSGHWKIGK